MNVCGLGNSFHSITKAATQSLKFIILACCIFSVSNLSPMHPVRLTELLYSTFDAHTPGLNSLIPKINERGFAFEAEVGLILACRSERVIGFDLGINFKDGFATVCIDEMVTTLGSTEFDVIANQAIECKSGATPLLTDQNVTQYSHYTHKALKQEQRKIFSILQQPTLSQHQRDALLYELQPIAAQALLMQCQKEKVMLTWCKELAKEIDTGQITFSFLYSQTHRPYVVINGPATCYKDTAINLTWFTTPNQQECTQIFIEIIHLLATKDSMVFFSGNVTPVFARLLYDANIVFEDDIHFIQEDATALTAQFSGMQISPSQPSVV